MTQLNAFFEYQGISMEDIPKIPLYMDQLLSLLDVYFSDLKRETDEKTLTKTMVNNYVKAQVIGPPKKKKYTKEQLMLLALVYQLKNILSIGDIKGLFDLHNHSDTSSGMMENAEVERYFQLFNTIEMEHLSTLKARYNDAIAQKEGLFITRLLVEADLNKRLALLLMDDMQKKSDDIL